VKVTVIPTSGEDGLATGAEVVRPVVIVIGCTGEADLTPLPSVMVTATLNGLPTVVVNVCWTEPVVVVWLALPSPKLQLNEKEATPPDEAAVKVTSVLTAALLGPFTVAPVRRAATLRVLEAVALTALASVTVTPIV